MCDLLSRVHPFNVCRGATSSAVLAWCSEMFLATNFWVIGTVASATAMQSKKKKKSKLKIAQYPSLRARSETLLQAKVTACQVGSKPRMGCLWGCRWADGIVPTGTLVLCHWLLHFSPGGRPGIFGIDLPLPAVRMPRSSHDSWAGRCCLPPGWIDSRLPHTARLFGHAFFAGGRWERGCVAAE